MKFYNKSSIRVKIKLIILSVCFMAILLVFAGFYIYEMINSRQMLLNDLSTKGGIIAKNVDAALAFSDSSDAAEVLLSLETQPNIRGAAIYDAEGNIFVTYRKENHKIEFPAKPNESEEYIFSENVLTGFEPVYLGNEKIGSVYLVLDLSEQIARSESYIKIGLLVMFGTLIISFIVATLVAKNISAPIVSLAGTAEKIAKLQDYSIRAEKKTSDETGLLVDSFNDMLNKIMERDRNIRETNINLQNAEKRYRTTLDNMLEGAQIIGFDWTYLYLNEVAVKQSRFPREKLIGAKITDVYPGIEDTELFKYMKLCMEERKPHYMENEFIYPDGSVSWYNLNIEPVPEGIFILSADITEEKMLQQELKKYHEQLEELVKQRTEQLQEANSELESFTYTVSHDLRAPVRHISGFLDILRKNISKDLDQKNERYLNLIKEAAVEMGNLIDDLLTFSRTAKAQITLRPVNLNYIVDEEIEKLKPDFEGRKITWEISKLPEVKGDPHLLGIVMCNLISNAVKFTAKKEEAVITINCQDNDDKHLICVKDNGAGFEMEYYDKLFGVFQRLHNTSDFPGTGIGLATVKKIISKHGGEVWAQSKPGEGASFFFSLPKINDN